MTYEESTEIFRSVWNELGLRDKTINDAFRNAIESMEKQIPKKPTMKIVEKRIIKGLMYPHCPVCNTIPVPHPNVSYCDYCGQAIDWSNE